MSIQHRSGAGPSIVHGARVNEVASCAGL